MAAVTIDGFVVRTLEQIVAEIGENLKSVFGSTYSVDPSSPDGQLIGIFAAQLWEVEQAAQAAYQCSDPNSAQGVPLEYVCDYNGVYRKEGEPDAQLRRRRAYSVINSGTNTIDSIYAALLKLDVKHVSIKENDTSAAAETIPSKAFLTVVDGGDPNEIAKAIFLNKPVGIRAYGTTTINVKDSKGYSHAIGFSRPTNANLAISISFKRTGDSSTTDIMEAMRKSIEAYTNNLAIGEDVIWSSLLGAAVAGANEIAGSASITSLRMSKKGGTLGTGDIHLLPYEQAHVVHSDIAITEVGT